MMESSAEERRRWRELAAELRHGRRLTAHADRFDATVRWRRDMETARGGTAIPAVVCMPAVAGGCMGLALIPAGLALLAIGTAGCRK
ncbi:MAG TPA: hypothetical protein VFO01_02880 [Trebonia sp.]|nr:hypothetical protein [Trebonia sp.]